MRRSRRLAPAGGGVSELGGAGVADVVLGDAVRVGEVDVDREPLNPVSLDSHGGPALAGGRQREHGSVPDRQEPVGAVTEPAELALAAALAEQPHVAAAHRPFALALTRGRGRWSGRLVFAGLAVDRLDHRLFGPNGLVQSEQSWEGLQVELAFLLLRSGNAMVRRCFVSVSIGTGTAPLGWIEHALTRYERNEVAGRCCGGVRREGRLPRLRRDVARSSR